jgi:hypothetical protein
MSVSQSAVAPCGKAAGAMAGRGGRRVTLVRRSVGLAEAGTKAEAAKPAPHADIAAKLSGATALARSASLIFAGRILEAKGEERSEHAAEAASLVASSGASIEGPCGGSAARSACSSRPHKSAEIAPFSAVSADSSVSWSAFLPILSADVSAVASSGEVFRSLGSKTDPVLHVRFPNPWRVVAENREIAKWRCLLMLVRTAVLGDE